MSPGVGHHRSGWTLTEVLAVVVILALVTVSLLSAQPRQSPAEQLEAMAVQLAAWDNRVRVAARDRGGFRVTREHQSGQLVAVAKADDTDRLVCGAWQPGWRLRRLDASPESVAESSNRHLWLLRADGTTDDLMLELSLVDDGQVTAAGRWRVLGLSGQWLAQPAGPVP